MTFYNDIDPVACEWLRELIRGGLIPQGHVDERPIQEVSPDDVVRYRQQHYFCGIAGWPAALRLAGFPADIHTFTGSPPCQPFSTAGKRKGKSDERHLWPEYFRLIRDVRPLFVFCEQVEGAARLGWLDGVQADLEGAGYTFWPVVLGSHSIGAPHIRLRFFAVAFRNDAPAVLAERARTRGVGLADTGHRIGGRAGVLEPRSVAPAERDEVSVDPERRGGTVGADGHARGVFHPAGIGRREGRAEPVGRGTTGGRGDGRLENADGEREGAVGGVCGRPVESQPDGSIFGLANDQGGGCDEGSGSEHGTSGVCRSRLADGGGVGDTDGRGRGEDHPVSGQSATVGGVSGSSSSGLADADGRESGDDGVQPGGEHRLVSQDGGVGERAAGVPHGGTVGHTGSTGPQVGECDGGVQRGTGRAPAWQAAVVSSHAGFWSAFDLIHCRDNKWRRIPAGSSQSVLFGLAYGLQHGLGGGGVAGGGHGEGSFPLSFGKVEGRAAVLKGGGNAISPQIAAEFVSVVMEVLGIQPEYTHGQTQGTGG